MASSPRRISAPTLGEDQAELLRQISADVAAMRSDHMLMKQTLGEASPDNRGGTGLVGSVNELKHEMRGLLGLKNQGFGIFVGALLVVAVIVLGIKGVLAGAFAAIFH